MKNKLKNLRASRWLTIITPIITFVFGVIGGELLEAVLSPLFDTSNKIIFVELLTIGLLSVIILITVTRFAYRAEERENVWLDSVGVPAQISFEQATYSKGDYFQKLIEFINMASEGDEILIMTQHKSTVPIDVMTKSFKQLRDKYCKLLLQKVKEENIAYSRIVCFDDFINEATFNTDCMLPWLVDHFREMLKMKKVYPDNISIKMSRKKLGADIFVIPGKVGAVVLDVYDVQSGVTSTNSSLFFHNPPNKQIVEQLHSWFKEIDKQTGTIPIDDIPLPNASPKS